MERFEYLHRVAGVGGRAVSSARGAVAGPSGELAQPRECQRSYFLNAQDQVVPPFQRLFDFGAHQGVHSEFRQARRLRHVRRVLDACTRIYDYR